MTLSRPLVNLSPYRTRRDDIAKGLRLRRGIMVVVKVPSALPRYRGVDPSFRPEEKRRESGRDRLRNVGREVARFPSAPSLIDRDCCRYRTIMTVVAGNCDRYVT